MNNKGEQKMTEQPNKNSESSFKGKLLGFVEMNNTLRIEKFKGSNIGKAVYNKFDKLGVNSKDSREGILTNKNNIIALLLDGSDVNETKLNEITQEATEKALRELEEFKAKA